MLIKFKSTYAVRGSVLDAVVITAGEVQYQELYILFIHRLTPEVIGSNVMMSAYPSVAQPLCLPRLSSSALPIHPTGSLLRHHLSTKFSTFPWHHGDRCTFGE